jgi:hypothetical protein
VWLAILFTVTRGENTPGLSLNVREITLVINNNVASFTSGLWTDNTLGGNDLSSEGCLVLVGVYLDLGMVMVRGVLKEVLLQVERSSVYVLFVAICKLGCVRKVKLDIAIWDFVLLCSSAAQFFMINHSSYLILNISGFRTEFDMLMCFVDRAALNWDVIVCTKDGLLLHQQ